MAFPLKNFQCEKSSKKTWITRGILKSRENLLRIAENASLSKDEAYHLYFKNYRRIYKNVLIAAKALNNKQRIEKATCRGKELWKVVKELEKGCENTPKKKMDC